MCSQRCITAFSPDGVVVTTGHDVPGMTTYQGEAWCDAEGTPVMHHVIDMPSNLTLCAEQGGYSHIASTPQRDFQTISDRSRRDCSRGYGRIVRRIAH